MFMALESVLLGIVKDMGSPTGFISEFARFIRDYPDQFSMFSAGSEQVPSMQHVRVCKTPLAQFNCEKREAGHSPSAIFGAFMNTYMDLGSQVMGALELADRIEAWDPEHQAALREAGLRSSFELGDDEGSVFIAITADRYPIGLMGRRNTARRCGPAPFAMEQNNDPQNLYRHTPPRIPCRDNPSSLSVTARNPSHCRCGSTCSTIPRPALTGAMVEAARLSWRWPFLPMLWATMTIAAVVKVIEQEAVPIANEQDDAAGAASSRASLSAGGPDAA